MHFLVFIFTALSFCFAQADEKYSPTDRPPASGYKAATKFFKKGGRSSTKMDTYNVDRGNAGKDTLLSLDTEVFVNNRPSVDELKGGDWGLSMGFYWDETWLSQGLELDYLNYDQDQKVSLLGGLSFPRIQTRFPLYIKGNVGLGYFTGDRVARETLSVDYNVYTGVRFFSRNMQFNIEVGSKNYTMLLKNRYLNSFVLSSGLSVLF